VFFSFFNFFSFSTCFFFFFLKIIFFFKLSLSILFFLRLNWLRIYLYSFFVLNIVDCYSIFSHSFCFATVFSTCFFFSKIIFVEFIFLILRWLRI
jgi:hypothetical protein